MKLRCRIVLVVALAVAGATAAAYALQKGILHARFPEAERREIEAEVTRLPAAEAADSQRFVTRPIAGGGLAITPVPVDRLGVERLVKAVDLLQERRPEIANLTLRLGVEAPLPENAAGSETIVGVQS